MGDELQTCGTRGCGHAWCEASRKVFGGEVESLRTKLAEAERAAADYQVQVTELSYDLTHAQAANERAAALSARLAEVERERDSYKAAWSERGMDISAERAARERAEAALGAAIRMLTDARPPAESSMWRTAKWEAWHSERDALVAASAVPAATPEQCAVCQGRGHTVGDALLEGGMPIRCDACDGTGEFRVPAATPGALPDADVWRWTCHLCGYFVESVETRDVSNARSLHVLTGASDGGCPQRAGATPVAGTKEPTR